VTDGRTERNVGVRSTGIKTVMSERFTGSDQPNREDDCCTVIVRVQWRTGNKMLEAIKATAKGHLAEADVVHPSRRRLQAKLTDTAIVFTEASHDVRPS
jgi:hypothetical protein